MERLRGFTAVLMVAVVDIVSFAAAFARAAQASSTNLIQPLVFPVLAPEFPVP
jgi:hypothetical protein